MTIRTATLQPDAMVPRPTGVSAAWTSVALEAAGQLDGCREFRSRYSRGRDAEGAVFGNPLGRIGWQSFDEFLDGLAEALGGSHAWFDFGRRMAFWSTRYAPAVGAVISPKWMTEWSLRHLRNRLLPGLHAESSPSPSGSSIRVKLALPDGLIASREAFYWITAGQCAVAPTALNLPESIVHADVHPNAADLTVHLPPSRTLSNRVRRTLTALVSLKRSATSLELREFELAKSKAELDSLAIDFRQLIDVSPHGIFIHDAGTLFYANEAFLRSFAHGTGQIRPGENIADRLQFREKQDAASFLAPKNRTVVDTPPQVVHARTRGGDAPEIVFEMLGSREVMFEGKLATLVFCRDITSHRKLERQVIDASEKERRRVALDLHDGLGQLLAAVSMQSQLIKLRAKSASPEILETQASELASTALEALELTRSLARGLAPVAEFDGGLPGALARLVARVSENADPDIGFSASIAEGFASPGEESDLHLYRIAQEALRNAIVHARAKRIDVHLGWSPGSRDLTLEITDDGIGLPHDLGSPSSKRKFGIGLHAIRYRAAATDADLEIGAGPTGSGTSIRLRLRSPQPTASDTGDPGRSGTAAAPSAAPTTVDPEKP